MSALKPYEPASTHWDTARERDVDMKLDAEEREIDSREKLEADVQKHFTHRTSTAMWPPSANNVTDWVSVSMETVLGWLDRQAAITERECMTAAGLAGTEAPKLQAKADELTEERDGLRRQVELKDGIIEGLRQSLDETIDERNALSGQVDDLTKERDRALADAKTQRNNFETATKAREHWKELAAKSKGEVDDLRQSLDETIEERNELQAKLDDFDGDCYCGATVVQWYEHSVRLQGRLDEMEQTRMRLPVDAEDVPVRPGDYMELGDSRGEVKALSYAPYDNELPWQMQLDDGEWYATVNARHAKPDTVESLLDEFMVALHELGEGADYGPTKERMAERIRKAVE